MLFSELDRDFLSELVLDLVVLRLGSEFFAGLNTQHLCQLHQVFIASDIEESIGMRLPVSIYALKSDLWPACKAALVPARAHPSVSQLQVSHTL